MRTMQSPRRIMTSVTIVALIAVLAACLPQTRRPTTSPPADQVAGVAGLAVGDTQSTGIGRYRKLLATDHGWAVWETADTDAVVCVAVKPSIGWRQPMPSEGGGLVAGAGGGFLVRTTAGTDASEPEFAFYGRQKYPKGGVSEIGGQIYNGPLPTDETENWDGRQGRFEITTGPYLDQYAKAKRETGEVDLSGLNWAVEAVERCAADAPPPPQVVPQPEDEDEGDRQEPDHDRL